MTEKQKHIETIVIRNTDEFMRLALVTESIDFETIKTRLSDERTIRALHAAIGLVTEAGELLDAFKKHIFYGRILDWINIGEETGDLFWYLAILADVMGEENFYRLMSINITKLHARYGDKFSDHAALNRNLNVERTILEEPNFILEKD